MYINWPYIICKMAFYCHNMTVNIGSVCLYIKSAEILVTNDNMELSAIFGQVIIINNNNVFLGKH